MVCPSDLSLASSEEAEVEEGGEDFLNSFIVVICLACRFFEVEDNNVSRSGLEIREYLCWGAGDYQRFNDLAQRDRGCF